MPAKPRKFQLHWQILIALVLALILGQLTRLGVGTESFGFHRIGGFELIAVYDFIGQMFLRALQMLIVPLIAAAIITGVAGLAGDKSFGRMGLKTIGYYLMTSTVAILIGLVLVNLIQPGKVDGEQAAQLFGLTADPGTLDEAFSSRGAGDIAGVFLRMIPSNVFDSATQNGQMLSIIFFSVLFGYFVTRLPEKTSAVMRDFWQGVYDVMLMITGLVMKFAPIGVFGLVARVSASTSPADFGILFTFFFTVLLALAIHFFVALPLMLLYIGRIKPSLHFKAMFPALLTAFSTSSSSATLPVTIDCLEKRANVSHRTTSFVTPLGATINMDGTALYECVAVLFIAQLYGIEITLGVQIIVVVLALLTSIGVAGVPSASLVAIVVILAAIGLPAEAIGVLMVFDRILDMCRTSVNVFSDTCGAAIIARSEGEITHQ